MEKQQVKIFDLQITAADMLQLDEFLIRVFDLNRIAWNYDINSKLAVDYYNIGLYNNIILKNLYCDIYSIYTDAVTYCN